MRLCVLLPAVPEAPLPAGQQKRRIPSRKKGCASAAFGPENTARGRVIPSAGPAGQSGRPSFLTALVICLPI